MTPADQTTGTRTAPSEFMERLYQRSQKGGRVWDPCCGTGSIPKAADALSRQGHGTDINPDVSKFWGLMNYGEKR